MTGQHRGIWFVGFSLELIEIWLLIYIRFSASLILKIYDISFIDYSFLDIALHAQIDKFATYTVTTNLHRDY